MSSVTFRGFEGDGQSVINFNGQTPVMSRTSWLSDPTRGTGVLTRRNGSYEKLAISNLAIIEYQMELKLPLSVKVLCKPSGSYLEIESGSTGSLKSYCTVVGSTQFCFLAESNPD